MCFHEVVTMLKLSMLGYHLCVSFVKLFGDLVQFFIVFIFRGVAMNQRGQLVE